MRKSIRFALSACLAMASVAAFSQSAATMAYKAAATTKFGPHPALPACATIAVQDGNPGTGPSIIMLRAKAGCVLPWHWHTPNERLIIVSGSAKADMKDAKPTTLHPGDFILLPSKGIHQFTALTSVELFDISDAPFDMHYVDASGTEIPVATALKPKAAAK